MSSQDTKSSHEAESSHETESSHKAKPKSRSQAKVTKSSQSHKVKPSPSHEAKPSQEASQTKCPTCQPVRHWLQRKVWPRQSFQQHLRKTHPRETLTKKLGTCLKCGNPTRMCILPKLAKPSRQSTALKPSRHLTKMKSLYSRPHIGLKCMRLLLVGA